MHYKSIVLLLVFLLSPVMKMVAQDTIQLSADDIAQYQSQSEKLIGYLEDTFNFLGDTTQPISEKEIIINESYAKVFRDDKVQVEDDPDQNRRTPLNKNIQAYMKDILFFYKTVHFTFNIQKVEQLVNDKGGITFKITFNRRLQGITINNDTVDNNQIRYMEINLNLADKDLKIASIYTTKLNEKENLRLWWNVMSNPWKDYFGKSILIYDTLPLNMILSFSDSTIVTPVWKAVQDTSHRLQVPDSVQQIATDTTNKYIRPARFEKIPDTLQANTSILYNLMRHLQKANNISISNNLMIRDLRPLAAMDDLQEVSVSNTLIDDVSPLRNLGKLERLNISGTAVTDLTPLKFAWHLQSIDFSNTAVSSLVPLGGLSKLETVKGDGSLVKSLVPLNNHRFLRTLKMADCPLTNIDSLHGLPALTQLDLHADALASVDSIGRLSALQQLNLDSTFITSIASLAELPSLSILQINSTAVANLTPLLGLSHLKIVYCDKSRVQQAEAMRFMNQRPDCQVIFNSAKLEYWWRHLSPEWKNIFKPFLGEKENLTKVSLHKLIQITKLDISNRKEITDLQPLTMLYQLEELHLDGTSIQSLAPLSEESQLTLLTFDNTSVAHLAPLKNLQHLQNIRFSGTLVSDLMPLKKNKNLKEIACNNTKVNAKNVSQLLDVLPNCIVLFETQQLEFWWNNLNDSWQNAFRKIGGFEENPSSEQIHHLCERRKLKIENFQESRGLEAFTVFFRLATLTLNNSQLTDISPLVALSGLQTLRITNGPLSDLTGIEKLTNLRTLILQNTAIDDLYLLSGLTQLTALDVSGTKVKSLKPLQKLTGLRELIINNTKVKSLKPIMSFQHIKLLKCYNTPLRKKKVEAFKAAHPNVEVVYY